MNEDRLRDSGEMIDLSANVSDEAIVDATKLGDAVRQYLTNQGMPLGGVNDESIVSSLGCSLLLILAYCLTT